MICLPNPAPQNPLPIVDAWLTAATRQDAQPHANAITLASVSTSGRPSARVVLIKHLSLKDGYIVFHSHYGSRKGLEFANNPWAAAVVHWDHLSRQIRFEGLITKSPKEESDAYFATRDWRSQLNAWSSEQSQPISDRNELLNRANKQAKKMSLPELNSSATDRDFSLQRPPFWGGYRLWFRSIEFWTSKPARFHDRVLYERSLKQVDNRSPHAGSWSHQRLQP